MKLARLISFACLALIPAARATLLVHESYDGKTAGALAGQGTAGTVGFTGNYTFGGTVTDQSFTVIAGSLAFSGYNSSAGFSVRATSDGSGATTRAQTTGGFNVTGTLYSSYLINFSSLGTNSSSLAEVRAATTENSAGSDSTTMFRSMADSTSGTEIRPGIGYDNGAASTTSTLGLNTTYMIVSRYTNVGNVLGAGPASGIATLFALTANQWDFFIAGGGTDAYLDAAAVGTGAGQITTKVSETLTSGTYTFAAGNWIQTAVGSGGNNSTAFQTFVYDEIRYGNTLADVTVPEPSTMLLGALAPLAFLIRRKR